MKTKLGLSIGVVAMGVYLLGLFGGYTALLLAVGYVMMVETNDWLRKSAVKALALAMMFSLISYAIGFLPDVLGVLNSFLNTFEVSFRYYWLTSLLNAVQGAVNICEILLFANLAIKALNCADVPVKPIDQLLAHMDTTSAE
ncbi:MAG: hypothetical protein IJY28_10215 [Clostridia bacterium]|nr:hypothetical protein [Clostridia bacterium]